MIASTHCASEVPGQASARLAGNSLIVRDVVPRDVAARVEHDVVAQRACSPGNPFGGAA